MTEQPIHVDPDLTVPVFLRRIAEAYGDRTALVFGDQTWTYRRLYDDVRRMEAALLSLGVVKGTRVALLMGNRPEWAIAAFASMSLGAVCSPLSTYEPAKKLEQLLRHSDASLLILQDRLLRHTYLDDLLSEHPGLAEDGPFFDETLPFLRRVVHLGDARNGGNLLSWDALVAGRRDLPGGFLESAESEIHPTDDALVIYTSGTSGPSKGVVHTHRSVTVQLNRIHKEFTLRADDVVWGTYPMFWSAGFAWLLGATLSAGATLVLQEWFNPREALDLIEKHRVSVLHVTPPQITELEHAWDERPVDLSSLRIIPRGAFAGRVNLPPDHPAGGASLGLTEALTLASSIPWDSPLELRTSTHGRALPGISIKIVNPDTGETLGPNEFGEIAIKGTGLMRGYHKVFPESYLDPEGYYRTRDAGYLDEAGYLHFTGRLSEVIRTNAANVSPREVEAALYDLPGIRIAAVVGVPDDVVGERIVACVVPKPDAVLTEQEIRHQLKDRLAGYKIPARVLFFEESELPMTATAKPVLAAVRSLAAERIAAESTQDDGVRR